MSIFWTVYLNSLEESIVKLYIFLVEIRIRIGDPGRGFDNMLPILPDSDPKHCLEVTSIKAKRENIDIKDVP
jgi:hypothetical protein